MAFPQSPLDVVTELLIGGTLVDVTPDVRGADDIVITRVRRDERSRPSFGRGNLTLNNRLGKYSDNNPNSIYYGKIGRNTIGRIAVRPHYTSGPGKDTSDSFTRTVSNSWGTSTTGDTWYTASAGGSLLASDYNVNGTEGTLSVPVTNAYRMSYLNDIKVEDANMVVTFKCPQATGAPLEPANIALRGTSISSYILFRVQVETTNAVTLVIFNRGGTVLKSVTIAGLVHTGVGKPLRIRARSAGSFLMARIWDASLPEPTTWDAFAVDNDAPVAGYIGVRCGVSTGNTNALPVVFTLDNYSSVTELTRITGEISEWPQRWDTTGKDVWVPITISGVLRRLRQGAVSLHSPLYRAITARPELRGYWTMEDSPGSTTLASAMRNGQAMNFTGLNLRSDATEPGSEPLPTFGSGGSFSAPVSGTFNGHWQIDWYYKFNDPTPSEAKIFTIFTSDISGAAAGMSWDIFVGGATANVMTIRAYNSAGTNVVNIGSLIGSTYFGQWVHARFTVQQSGGNIQWRMVLYPLTGNGVFFGATVAGTVGAPNAVVVFPSALLNGMSIGHVAALDMWDIGYGDAAQNGYIGETVVQRLNRLSYEQGIPIGVVGVSGKTMGSQRADTFINLVNDCVDVDMGILSELRGGIGLQYFTIDSLYNPVPVILDYKSSHLSGDLQPTTDDQQIQNAVTAKRNGGSTYRATHDKGPLSVQPPPNGVGVYDRGDYPSQCELDLQLRSITGWLLRLGTWPETRYPAITVNLARAVFAANHALSYSLARTDAGSHLALQNLPAWLPPNLIIELVQGYTERISNSDQRRGWELTFNATPGGPYDVFTLDGVRNRLADNGNSTLQSGVSTTATTLTVASTTALWSTRPGDYPSTAEIEGERMTVTNVTGATSPQTFTVTRSINGIVKTHGAGAMITVVDAYGLAY